MFVFVGLAILLDVETIRRRLPGRHGLRHGLPVPRPPRTKAQAGSAYGFFIPIFFIHVGLEFDLQALLRPGVFAGALALLVAAVAVKVVAALTLFIRRFSARDVLSAGVLLSARLSLVIAVAQIGTRLGLMDRALESQVILLALVTATLGPTLFRLLQGPKPLRVGESTLS